MSESAAALHEQHARQRVSNKFFVSIAAVMLIAVLLGFSRTFFLRAFNDVTDMLGSRSLPPHLVMHGIALTAWYGLFLIQSWLGALHRVALHRTLGVIGVVVAAAVVITSAVTTYRLVPRSLEAGRDIARLTAIEVNNFIVLVSFALLVAVAVYFRTKSAIHKRLMLLASVAIIGPAFASGNRPLGQFIGQMLPPTFSFRLYLLVTAIAIAALVAYDYSTNRKLHIATVWGGLAVIASKIMALSIEFSPLGPAFVRWLASTQSG